MLNIRKTAVLGAIIALGTAIGTGAILSTEQPRSREARLEDHKRELLGGYDLSDAAFDTEDLVAPGVAKDGIPALTDPNRTLIPRPNDRVVEVEINGAAAAYPLSILNWHEIVNDRLGGVPIAVTYCPLCDSVSVFDRRLVDEDGSETVLEFGVSGLLHNSNVVMYERGTGGLWSQVKMEAISGPHVGRALRHLPVRVVSFADFHARHPDGEVLSTQTGHERRYRSNPYEGYLKNPQGVFHAFEYDDRLPPKELGLGIAAGEKSYFVRASAAMDGPIEVDTPMGVVRVLADGAGLRVLGAPEGVRTVQTFYHSFSAFYPETTIVPRPDQTADRDSEEG